MAIAMYLAPLAMLATAAGSNPSAITVTGRVSDEDHRPLVIAYAECAAAPNANGPRVFVDVKGGLSATVATDGTHLFCIIGAKGYLPLHRTVVVINGHADFGVAILKKNATIEVGKPLIYAASNGSSTNIDIIVRNPGDRDFEVRGIIVTATARLATECYDPRPAIDFKISERIGISRLKVSSFAPGALHVAVSSPENNWNDMATASGALQTLGCHQSRLNIKIDYLLSIRHGDMIKLRFQLPNTFISVSGRAKKTPPIKLGTWEGLSIDFVLSDGTKARSAN